MDDRNRRRLRSRGVRIPSSSSGGNGASGDRGNGFVLSFAELSALVLVFGAIIYVLGFFAFLVPIWRHVTHDATTAMYATSLVPRTVVAGTGVSQLLAPSVILLGGIVTFFIVVGFLFNFLARLNAAARLHRSSFSRAKFWLSVLFILVPLPAGAYYVASSKQGLSVPESVLFAGVFLALGLVSVWSVYGVDTSTDTNERTRQGTSDRTGSSDSNAFFDFYFVWFTIILIVYAIAAPFARLYGYPDAALPRVEITQIVQAEGNPENLETTIAKGDLLTHSEGFWYLFNQDGALVAVSDAKVRRVHVSPP